MLKGLPRLHVDVTALRPGAWILKYCISLCWCVWWKCQGGPTNIFYVVCLQREPLFLFTSCPTKSHLVVVSRVPCGLVWLIVPSWESNGNDFAPVRPTPLENWLWAPWLQCWLLTYLIFCLSPHGGKISEKKWKSSIISWLFILF